METLQINGMEIPLLEPPHKDNDIPRRILYVLFKHKLFIAAAFLVVSLPVLIAILLQPTKYIAVSKVIVQPKRALLNLDPTTGGGNAVNIFPSPEMINSEIQIIKSRELRNRLVKEVPFPEKSNGYQEDIRLEANPIKLSNLIQISAASSNPEWVARVVNRAVELYVEQHLKINKAQGIEEFYEDQEKKLRVELIEAEKALKEYQEKEKIVEPEQELTATLARLTAFETTLRTTESAIRESNEKIRAFEGQLREQQPSITSSKHVSVNPVYDRIRDKVIQLELDRDSLLQRYTPNDRLVRDKEKEIADLNKQLANILSDKKTVWSTNSVYQGILHSLLTVRAELTGLEARKSSLLKQVATYSSEAAELKKKSFAYDRLRQDVNARKEALAFYKRKAEEARVSDAMDERKFGNVSIFERASLPLPPAGWSPLMAVLATLLVSLAIAVGGAFAIEFFNTNLRDETDVEKQIDLPVLATIQYHRS
jgi:uncharacterized protein involved in exopolysaccharide biosynthesis